MNFFYKFSIRNQNSQFVIWNIVLLFSWTCKLMNIYRMECFDLKRCLWEVWKSRKKRNPSVMEILILEWVLPVVKHTRPKMPWKRLLLGSSRTISNQTCHVIIIFHIVKIVVVVFVARVRFYIIHRHASCYKHKKLYLLLDYVFDSYILKLSVSPDICSIY